MIDKYLNIFGKKGCYLGECGRYDKCYGCYGWKADIRSFIAWFTTLKLFFIIYYRIFPYKEEIYEDLG